MHILIHDMHVYASICMFCASCTLHPVLCRSEGFPLTCYFIPGRDGTGVWTTGKFCRRLPPFLQEAKKNSDMTVLLRPAGGEQNIFKIYQISC